MKFIKPSEISSKIMTLLDESDDFVLLVSPYVKISKWYKFLKKLNGLVDRNIPINFVVREDINNQNSFDELNKLGYRYTGIKDLHCKLYMNEKYAIVSSMNLLLSSEINSIELAYITEDKRELDELKEFCIRYLSINPGSSTKNLSAKNFIPYIIESIESKLGKVTYKKETNSIKLRTRLNNYEAFIWNDKQNRLRISGILTNDEYEYLLKNKNHIPSLDNLKIDLQFGGNNHYNTIWGTSDLLIKSNNINKLNENETDIISKSVVQFICKVDELKIHFSQL